MCVASGRDAAGTGARRHDRESEAVSVLCKNGKLGRFKRAAAAFQLDCTSGSYPERNVRLSTETLQDCVRVFAHRLVGKADEDRNGDDQQQAHHDARAAQTALGALDVVYV